jgi:6-pyruvoyl-tetrahydropterin synthase
MKRVAISAVIIVAAVIYSIFAAVFSAMKADEIKEITEQIDKSYMLYRQTHDLDIKVDAIMLASRLETVSERFENSVSLFVRDDRLSTLEYSAARVKHLIEFESDEVAAELETINEQVETISESERPYWYNIL